MSENIQPSSEDNQIVEDLANEESSEKLLEFKDKEPITNVEQNRFECRSCGYILVQRAQRKETCSCKCQTTKY